MTRPRRDLKDVAATLALVAAVAALRQSRDRAKAAGSPITIAARDRSGLPRFIIRWSAIVRRTAMQSLNHGLLAAAAGVTFYGLLALFPALTALVSLYGLMADPRAITDHLNGMAGIVPGGGLDIIGSELGRLTAKAPGKLGTGAVLGLAMALWSANQGTTALFSALNTVYGEKEKRGYVALTAQSLAFTAGSIIFLIAALAAVVLLPILFNVAGLATGSADILDLGRWPIILLLAALFMAFLYRFGPSRGERRCRWVTPGSIFASLAWLGLSVLFSWYVGHFGSYDRTYGSLGAVIGFMTWIWLSTSVMLIGAQLNAEVENEECRGAC